MKIRNPYAEFNMQMQEQGAKSNPPGIKIGTVLSASPLVVKCGELQLDADNILIDAALQEGYSVKFSLPSTAATGTTSNGTISTIAIASGTLAVKSPLAAGDAVAIQATEDKQRYIILRKVVSPNG